MTDKELREMARNIGDALRDERIKNPHRLWKLEPRKREPEPRRKVLT